MSGLAPDERIFFIHVMKTGGATFRRRLEANLGVEHVYPNPDIDTDLLAANISLEYLTSLPTERMASLRAITGHFPFAATRMLPGRYTTLTVLRDPVERTISYLKHCKKYQERHHDMALEAIYEDPWYGPMLIENHQSKVFAFTADDHPESIATVFPVDDARLATAKAHLETVDVLGLHTHYDDFVDEVCDRFGWSGKAPPSWHVSEPTEVATSFRDRIAQDLRADVEFYEFAADLYAARRAGGRA